MADLRPRRSGVLPDGAPAAAAQRRRGRSRGPALLAACLAWACTTAVPPLPGSVRGRLTNGEQPSEPMAVFLEPLDGEPAPGSASPPLVVRSAARGFAPQMLAVAVGQSIRFTNDGPIYHQIFSYSEGNRFDLGLLRRGAEQTLVLRRPGVVPVYCSLHPAERLVLFVAPSPYVAAFVPPAAYEIRDVPPGRYRLHALSEHLDAEARAVTVHPGSIASGEIAAQPRTPRP